MQNFHQGLETITKQVLALVEKKLTPIILIDGRAGSGKSTFANQLADQLFLELEVAPRVVHMDDLYPGWEGLRSGSNYLNQRILTPLSSGSTASWQVWDWQAGVRGARHEPGNGWREFSGGIPIIIEGCGSLSRFAREKADIAIWIESDSETRKARLLQRDGHKFDEYWPTWISQEAEFYQQEKSVDLADLTLTN